MTFTISGEPYVFTLVIDNGVLTSFTAADETTTYQCFIQLQVQGAAEPIVCCTPAGCTSGPCFAAA